MSGVCFKCERPSILPGHNICALCHDEEKCHRCNGGSILVADWMPLRMTRDTHRSNRVVAV